MTFTFEQAKKFKSEANQKDSWGENYWDLPTIKELKELELHRYFFLDNESDRYYCVWSKNKSTNVPIAYDFKHKEEKVMSTLRNNDIRLLLIHRSIK